MTGTEKKQYKAIFERVGGDRDRADLLFLRWKCLTDLYFLSTEVFGWKNAGEGKRKRIDPKFHRWLCRILEKGGDNLILIPRGHLKTTFIKAKIVQRILQEPNIRLGLFSQSARLVEQSLADIKRLLALPLVRWLFPDLIPEPG